MMSYKLIHLLAVLVWVGGMFFAYVALRPAAVETLEPPQRLRLWTAVFRIFFRWVWASIGVLLASGLYMIYLFGGMANVPGYVHVMLALGLLMMLIFMYVFFSLYVPLGKNVAAQRWKEAGEFLGRIRQLIALNLALGIVVVCVVMLGMP
jgi:uncharacterized membrane protein